MQKSISGILITGGKIALRLRGFTVRVAGMEGERMSGGLGYEIDFDDDPERTRREARERITQAAMQGGIEAAREAAAEVRGEALARVRKRQEFWAQVDAEIEADAEREAAAKAALWRRRSSFFKRAQVATPEDREGIFNGYRERRNNYARVFATSVMLYVLAGLGGLWGWWPKEVTLPLEIAAAAIGFFTWFLLWVAFARAKGYPEITGWLAFLGPIGVIVLFLLPDKTKGSPTPPDK